MTPTKASLLVGGPKHGTQFQGHGCKTVEIPVWDHPSALWFEADESPYRYLCRTVRYEFTGELRHVDGQSIHVYSYKP